MNVKNKFPRSLKYLFMATTVLMLQACSSSTQPLQIVNVPAILTAPCAALQPLDSSTGAAILPWAVGVVEKYNDCAQRHSALVNAIK